MALLSTCLQSLAPPTGPDRLLDRIRWIFVALNVFATATTLLALMGDAPPNGVELAASLGLSLWAVTYYQQRARGVALNVMPLLLLFLSGLQTGADQEFVTTLYVVVFLQGLYPRTPLPRTLLILGYVAAYLPAAVVEGEEVVQWASDGFGFAFVSLIMGMVAAAARRHERLRRRDAILTRTMEALLSERRPDTVDDAVARAVLELVEVPETACSVWRGDGAVLERRALVGDADHPQRTLVVADLPDDLQSLFHRGEPVMLGPSDMERLQATHPGLPPGNRYCVVAPVVQDSHTIGLLVVASPNVVDEDLVEVLQRFAHEVSLLQQLIGRETVLTGVVDNSPDVIVVVDEQDVVRYVSPSVERVAGLDPTAVVDRPLRSLLVQPAAVSVVRELAAAGADGDVQHLQLQADGRTLDVEVTARPLATGGEVLNIRDVTERRRLQEEVEYRAFHDTTTGLPNRQLFMDRLGVALRRSARAGAPVAVLMIDLDDFKRVNDTLGHAAGDRLLVEAAHRIRSVTRDGDTPARLGGDEFAVLLVDVEDALAVTGVAERLLEALSAPLRIEGQRLELTASIGVAIGPELDASQLLQDADAAMYTAKSNGKGRWIMFDPDMHHRAHERRRLTRQLEAAMAAGELRLAYQPIVRLDDGSDALGVEALLRWTHPERGEIAPSEFVPLAEDSGLIVPLGRWVVREACRQLAAWDTEREADGDSLDRAPYMSVNLSSVQLRSRSIVTDVAEAVGAAGIDPSRLVLEVTETALVRDVDQVAGVLGQLKALGVRIAIDDFGTGYSSFSHLQQFPIDIIKVDRSFVSVVAEGAAQGALAEAIVRLAATLEIDTVAEGVEADSQAEVLASWGCRSGQGWLWSPARPPDEVAGLLRSSGRREAPA